MTATSRAAATADPGLRRPDAASLAPGWYIWLHIAVCAACAFGGIIGATGLWVLPPRAAALGMRLQALVRALHTRVSLHAQFPEFAPSHADT